MTTLHISTQAPPAPGEVEPPAVVYAATGNLAKVQRAHVWKRCSGCGETFRTPVWNADGKRFCVSCRREIAAAERAARGGGSGEVSKRGTVRYFSAASRRRLMHKLALIDKKALPLFLTLTYSDSAATRVKDSPDVWKLHLKAFLMRFRRRFPDGSGFWRLEVVDRKSGMYKGGDMPHFHLLLFNVRMPLADFQAWLRLAWYEVVGTGDTEHLEHGTYCEKVKTRKGVFRYASKTVANTMPREMAKTVQASHKMTVGRWWGEVNKDGLQALQSALVTVVLETERQALNVLRTFRKRMRLAGFNLAALTTFCAGDWLNKNLARLAEPVLAVRSYSVTGRRHDKPFWLHAIELGIFRPAWTGAP